MFLQVNLHIEVIYIYWCYLHEVVQFSDFWNGFTDLTFTYKCFLFVDYSLNAHVEKVEVFKVFRFVRQMTYHYIN